MYVQTAVFAPSRAITCMRVSVNKAVHMYDSFAATGENRSSGQRLARCLP